MVDLGRIVLPGGVPLLGEILTGLLRIGFFAGGFFFLIQIILGGIAWINAGGDPKAMQAARDRITNAMIGIVIVASAFAITVIVTTILGINIFGPFGLTIN